ncbi:uncharacterized protein LOC117101766 [Anneissia japonica]|uniref:uncharacterized protein LOC117101766 n=1 Tax=Anneissia japonica TaxID=1529436 RepID=UPI00142581BE|nr:uncharacterized protein LOC117101766 [Anneissia japonica]
MMNATIDETATSAIGGSLILVSTIAIICNVLFLVTISTARRSAPETLLLILSLLDLTFCILVTPISIVAYLIDWNIADTQSACDFQGTISFAIKFSSTFVVCCICLERYFCFKPIQTSFNTSWNGRAILVCTICVFFSLLVGAVPLIVGNSMKHFGDSMSYCHFNITPSDSVSTTFSVIVLICAYIMLQISMFCLVSVLCNWETYAVRTNPDERQDGNTVHARGNTTTAGDSNHKRGLTRMLLAVAFLHWCCHLPFMVLLAVTQIQGRVSQTADFIVVYILAVQPTLNPLVIFALHPPYYHRLKGKFWRKTNDAPAFNHSSDESRYRDVSQQDCSYWTRDSYDTIDTKATGTVTESFSHYVPSYSSDDDLGLIRLDGLLAEGSEERFIGQHHVDYHGMFNHAYYDSESLTCSTYSGSDVSDDEGTGEFDTDFSEYSYTSDEGHHGILYLNRRSRKIILPRHGSEALGLYKTRSSQRSVYGTHFSPHNSTERYITPNCISIQQVNDGNGKEPRPQLSLCQSDREQAQINVINAQNDAFKIDNNSNMYNKTIGPTGQTILVDEVNKEKTPRSRQIIGRRELRRLGIKKGRLTETFTRDSIPQETSLYQTKSQKSICLVCQGRYARHVPHSKHNVQKIKDAIVNEPPSTEVAKSKSKDPRFMNVLFQKALYKHSGGKDLNPNRKDSSDAFKTFPENMQNRQTGSAEQVDQHEDINYRQYIRHIASLKHKPVLTNGKHPPGSQMNGKQNNVSGRTRKRPNFADAITNLRNGNHRIVEEKLDEEYKAATLSEMTSEFDNQTTDLAKVKETDVNISHARPTTFEHIEGIEDEKHRAEISHSMQCNKNQLFVTENKSNIEYTQSRFGHIGCRDMDTGVVSDLTGINVGSKPVLIIKKVDGKLHNEDKNHSDVELTTESLSNNEYAFRYPMNIPKIEVTDLSVNDNHERSGQTFGDSILCQLRNDTKLSPFEPNN